MNSRPPIRDSSIDSPTSESGSTTATETTTLRKHEDLWFTDGSVVLQTRSVLFRVHSSLLSRHSVFFRDMFSLPPPGNHSHTTIPPTRSPLNLALAEQTYDGCPLVELHDSAEDVKNLLIALYDGPTFGNNNRADYVVVSGILRLSHKYIIDKLRTKAIAHLRTAWPTTLKDWDAREEVARDFEVDTGTPRAFRYPSPLVRNIPLSKLDLGADGPQDIIHLAQEVEAPCLLPAAFYDLSRYHHTQIFEQAEGGQPLLPVSPAAALSLLDVRRLSLGKEASHQAVVALIQSMATHAQRPSSMTLPPDTHTARGAHRGRRYSCATTAACKKDFAELIELATQHYLFDREKGCTDPLYAAEELGQLKSAEYSECSACAVLLEIWARKEREKLWKQIPTWFRLEVCSL